jgi:hypothetical protein
MVHASAALNFLRPFPELCKHMLLFLMTATMKQSFAVDEPQDHGSTFKASSHLHIVAVALLAEGRRPYTYRR